MSVPFTILDSAELIRAPDHIAKAEGLTPFQK